MRILISAGEASSDAHGAELLKALQREENILEAFGMGGAKLKECGLEIIIDSRELSVMGSTEVFSHLPKIFNSLKLLSKIAYQKKPDVAIVLDYPDFHFRLAQKLKKKGIPIIYYIPPKVWVWRRKRIFFLKRVFSKILCIFPFEESFYQKYHVPVIYVGNPLLDELPLHLLNKDLSRIHIQKNGPTLVIMPGSRKSELNKHLGLMLDAAVLTARKLKEINFLKNDQRLSVLLPFSSASKMNELQSDLDPYIKRYEPFLNIHISQGNAHECLAVADVGLIKSGTSTLEAALLKCPHVIVYKPSLLTAWIFKYIIRYRGPVGLVNLVSGWSPYEPLLVSELLMDQAKSQNIASELVTLFTDFSKRQVMLEGFEKLRQKLSGGSVGLSPSRRAAQEIIQFVKKLKARSLQLDEPSNN